MMTLTLLAAAQAVADTMAGANPVLTPVSSGEPQMNLWDMACKGGWIMIVLAVMSVIAFYIFFERAVAIRKAGKDDPLFMDRIRDYIKSGEIKSAINYCRITNTPSARMIEKGITRMGRPVADVQAAIENTGNIEVAKLENGLSIMATISSGAPMLGFLGTVTGMVRAFWNMANGGQQHRHHFVVKRYLRSHDYDGGRIGGRHCHDVCLQPSGVPCGQGGESDGSTHTGFHGLVE